VHDELAAYCFDRAVLTFGLAVEHAVESVEGKTTKDTERKRQRELDRWLGTPQKFRDPLADREKKG
jgi:broad specificity phosphatase PhoE